ncbi:hypothetical protein HQ520_06190 [bacterium]|nr:hypothetical protein [bacterium]
MSEKSPCRDKLRFPLCPVTDISHARGCRQSLQRDNQQAYRIRTPFGHAPLYASFDGQHGQEGRVVLTIKDLPDAKRSDSRAPYECIVYAVEMDRNLDLAVSIQATDGANARKVELSLRAN